MYLEKIMVVAAHPDDEVLGVGGTLSKLAKKGHEIKILVLGAGRDEDFTGATSGVVQKQAIEGVCNKLPSHFEVLDFPDNRYDSVSLLSIVRDVEKSIDDFMPATIFTHWDGDLNIDHRITSQAVMTAARPFKDTPVRDIYCFEVPSSTDWSFKRFPANAFSDISGYMEEKISLLRHYDSEMRKFPHPRSYENVKALARVWGAASGFEYAEAFVLARKTL